MSRNDNTVIFLNKDIVSQLDELEELERANFVRIKIYLKSHINQYRKHYSVMVWAADW